jgi:hypothetical protein
MRFLFTTLQTYESDFYGRVAAELVARGHEAAHVTVSRAAAEELRERGFRAYCLPDVVAQVGASDSLEAEVQRIEEAYPIPHIRDVYYADKACRRKREDFCVRRTIQHFRALEHIFDEVQPEVLVPEVGNETMRVVSHLIGLRRSIPVLFLLYTIFPNPLRLYVDTLHSPIVPLDALRELSPGELDEVETFRREFIARAAPIRAYHRWPIERRRVTLFAQHVRRRLTVDRDNEYLRPARLLWQNVAETVRGKLARPFYDDLHPTRPFVYFPLHVTDDYKILKVIPHCVDQASIVEQVADALPVGYDLVLKEHPMSIGRNSFALLRRLRTRVNVRLVPPTTSTHDLIRRSDAVAVISSTVGLEALLYEKPVLTVGQPFYSGYGVTLDVDSFRELRERVPDLLRFRPDSERVRRFLHAAMRQCYPGAPVLVDRSQENAIALAGSLEQRAREALHAQAGTPA